MKTPQSKSTKLDDELLEILDPDGASLSYCSGGGRCTDKGAIFDAGAGEWGRHILSSEQVRALHKYVESKVLEGQYKQLVKLRLGVLGVDPNRTKASTLMLIDQKIRLVEPKLSETFWEAELEATPEGRSEK